MIVEGPLLKPELNCCSLTLCTLMAMSRFLACVESKPQDAGGKIKGYIVNRPRVQGCHYLYFRVLTLLLQIFSPGFIATLVGEMGHVCLCLLTQNQTPIYYSFSFSGQVQLCNVVFFCIGFKCVLEKGRKMEKKK